MTDRLASEVCEEAIEVLDRQGWARTELLNADTGRVCLVGSLALAQDENIQGLQHAITPSIWLGLNDKVKEAVTQAVLTVDLARNTDIPALALIGRSRQPWVWNDHQTNGARSVDDVKDVLMTAAKSLRDQGL